MNLRLKGLQCCAAVLAAMLLLFPGLVCAQQTYQEDFTQSATKLNWFAAGGACLTAGNLAAAPSNPPGNIISCTANLTAYYQNQKDNDKSLVGGSTGTFPDAAGSGALRFTNGYPYGHNEAGSILSGFTFNSSQGVSITFNTVAYLGDKGGLGGDGADGMSFFIMDGCLPIAGATLPTDCDQKASQTQYGPNGYTPIGAFGGSLGYTCSNRNGNGIGLPGAFLGLGIDEFGNFLNGVNNTIGDTNGVRDGTYGPDNTLDGGYYDPGRIGIRGAGNVNWQYLNYKYGTDPGSNSSNTPYYPACSRGTGTYDSSLGKCESCPKGTTYNSTTQQCSDGSSPTQNDTAIAQEMFNTCSTGYLWNFRSGSNPFQTSTQVLDYSAISGGWTTTANIGGPIAAEKAQTRGAATPIIYNLQITSANKLSFQLSYNGGAYQNILTDTDINSATGQLPNILRFGFAGSTGGDTNVHELLCFQVSPDQLASSGVGNNNFQNPQLILGQQLFLGSYFPTQAWAGSVTAQNIGFSTKNNTVMVSPTPNWDARCVLTPGLTSCPSGAPNSPNELPSQRTILTWYSGAAYAFEYKPLPGNLQSALDGDDPASATAGIRVNYLRGDRTNEMPNGLNLYRTRTSVLGDVIDSTPTLVGPPTTYPSNIQWVDLLNQTASQPEGTGTTYAKFQSTYQQRENVVYAGANDGMLHGFRAGYFDANNNFATTTYANDGYEVLAYMPGVVAQTIHNTAAPKLDYSSSHYTHAYFVDATVGTGDVFYGGNWHTWVVGGLGAGASPGIYALDVTDPSKFAENYLSTVIGEWTPQRPGSCSSCASNMGSISGVPQIRRFHNGKWGVIFGNGIGSSTGDAGIFIMLLDQNTGSPSFIYLSGLGATTGGNDGIVSASAADIDGDHIVDYVYAGDILGNVWRFDLTDPSEGNWKKSQYSPIFTEPNGLPITTKVMVSTLREITVQLGLDQPTVARHAERVVLNFGTGQMTPQTVTAPTQYAAGPHYIYGIWDADFSTWNAMKNQVQPVVSFAASVAVPTIADTNHLRKQTITPGGTAPNAYRTVSQNPVCWPAAPVGTPSDNPPDSPTGCKPVNQMGWFLPLPGSGGTDATLDEQVIFDPIISNDGEFIVNTFIPTSQSPLLCNVSAPTGFTMALDPGTGGGSPIPFFFVNSNTNADGIQLNGTGVPLLVQSGQSADQNAQYLVTQTSTGTASTPNKTNRHVIVTGEQLNWVERR